MTSSLAARATAATLLWLVAACSDDARDPGATSAPGASGRLFTLLSADATGIRFENRLHETQERNVFVYRNYYNGGGVAIGDLDGDGRPDVVLTSNEEGPKLYLNQGGFRFRDVTRAAGLRAPDDGWTTGVVLADVDGDGRLDVYVCHAGPVPPAQRRNALWLNQGPNADGVPTFRDVAREYGVADEGFSTHAAFLDHDRDGDLDLFVINNSPRAVTSFGVNDARRGAFGADTARQTRDPHGGAQLYRNDGGRFTNVSAAAGIHSPEMAFGLGLAVSDVNRDGWPDIYVGNDFFERDYLYVNDRDGTFTDVADRAMPVISYFSMGLDIGDVDNDGWPDIYTTDMLPEDDYRFKTTSVFESWEAYQAKVRDGFHHQLSRNMLQRNNRDGTFSDVGFLAGVARTDWTWSALIADLDLDGARDIYVTNGMARDVTGQDYLMFLASDETMKSATSGGRVRPDFVKLTNAMTTTPLPNYAFRNTGNGRFSNDADAWGLATPSFSSGAAYGDLDGDGALDLVVNNVNQPAFVYRNDVRRLHPDRHALRVRLAGEGKNRFAIGARVTVFAGTDTLMQEQAPARGFQSSVDYLLIFGLGARAHADSIRVDWPDGRVSQLSRTEASAIVEISQSAATASPRAEPSSRPTLLTDVTERAAIDVRHRENAFVDFDRERLLPKLLSIEGPALAAGDVNGDRLDDLFIGGAKGQPGAVLLQSAGGAFTRLRTPVFDEDSLSEDVGAVFFDANGDGHQDLYVVSGGSEYSDGAPALQDRLYLNDGRGRFRKAEGAVPTESLAGSRVVAADYDGDGDVDLFVGTRLVPWRYGVDPRSMLLRNDGRGRFTDVATSLAPELATAGMVTDALWQDVDGDGRVDLVVVGEWMPITIFRNAGGGRLQRAATPGLEKSHGWWNRIIAGDFTGDGKVDFVAGNLGLNSRLSASETEPLTLHAKDFDGNGFFEQVLSMYNGGASYPIALRDDLLGTIPFLRSRFPSYKDYALKKTTDVFSAQELEGAVVKQATTLASVLVRNDGSGAFTLVALPMEAQETPIYGLLADDVNADGRTDLLLAGNFDGFKPEIGRLSVGRGLVLLGGGRGDYAPLPSLESGFVVPGQARGIVRVRTAGGPVYVVARNDDRPLVFRPRGRR